MKTTSKEMADRINARMVELNAKKDKTFSIKQLNTDNPQTVNLYFDAGLFAAIIAGDESARARLLESVVTALASLDGSTRAISV